MVRLLILLFITIVQIFGEPVPKVPGVSNDELQTFINDLWNDDSSKYLIENEYVKLGEEAKENKMPLPKLFQVNESNFFDHSTESLLSLFKEFDKPIESKNKEKAFDHFLTELLESRPMQKLIEFLNEHKYEPAKNETEFFEALKSIWFTPCKRQGNVYTSAFSHVFVGELNYQLKTVMGMHNWLRYFYLQKVKKDHLIYFGYHHASPNFVSIKYMHGAHMNNATAFFYGSRPEFDLAVYTLCYLTRPGEKACKFEFPTKDDNNIPINLEISTVEKSRDKDSKCLVTAYPCAHGKDCT